MTSAPPLTQEERDAIALTVASPFVHFTRFAAIETKDGAMKRSPTPSRFQRDIFKAYEWLVANNFPVRIIAAPKARQSYGSTTICHLCYHHTRRFHTHGMMMADEGDRTKKIWAMFQRFAENDQFEPFWDSKYEANTEVCRFRYRDDDGTKKGVARVAEWEHETANDSKAGAAGTRQVLWFSECMRYKRDGDAADFRVIGNAINSVPLNPGTAVFLESTAEGPGGYAFGIHQGAVTLKERLAGKVGNGWIKIFCAWHECDDYKLDPMKPENEGWFDDDDERFKKYSAREAAGITLYGWTPEQIAWRRQKIIGDNIGEPTFDRDFPDSEECAFRSSAASRFDLENVAKMMKAALEWSDRARLGSLFENTGVVRFQDDAQDGYVWMIEPPEFGRSYCLFADSAEGEQATGEESTLDCHAIGVLREAYRDDDGVDHPDEVVAVFHNPNGIRWNLAPLAERMFLLSKLYGKCIVVPESNNSGAALIILLKQLGLEIYQRQTPDAINPNKTVKASGFKTTARTKPQWVEALATAIDEETIRCRYLPAVKEFATFERKSDGTCEASSGKHDDWVAAIAIAVLCRCFTRHVAPSLGGFGVMRAARALGPHS